MESEGNTECLALSAKCYILSSDENLRIRAKGVPYVQKTLPQPLQAFNQVLSTQDTHTATVRGFRSCQGEVFSYEIARKTALSYAYVKRKVLSDGFTTVTIPFKIHNFKPFYTCIETQFQLLSPINMHEAASFTFNHQKHDCILHALIYEKVQLTHQPSPSLSTIKSTTKERDLY